jgi:membrane-bound lytic murein transglycosylase MltF
MKVEETDMDLALGSGSMMKQPFPLLTLAAILILSLVQPLFGQEKTGFNPLASHFSEKYTDDLNVLLKKKYIRVLTTFNRTNFFLSEGKLYGHEYSLLKEYEKSLNMGVKKGELRIVLEFKPVSRDRLVSGLVEGYGDIAAAGLTITPTRLKEADFTDPYLTGIDEVVITHKGGPKIRAAEDLSGREVFVRESSSYYESLVSLNRRLLNLEKRPVEIIKADEDLETEDILEMVNAGAIEITLSDSHIAGIWSKVLKNLQVHRKVTLRSGIQIAWMVRKNNPELKESLNRFLKKHRKGTLLGNIYFNRYYKDNPWIKNPLHADEEKKLKQCKPLFKKYATRYGFDDWMLVMAVAYQESGLDNTKRSSAGAVGIMQVRPETAKDKNIGIDKVHVLENNIHAGVKYLAFLRDRYYKNADISPRDQFRLTIAAYNAGPAKIRRARTLAKEMGLDPNRWFRHVELATLSLVGQETVRYVSNINKYYNIYRLYLEE